MTTRPFALLVLTAAAAATTALTGCASMISEASAAPTTPAAAPAPTAVTAPATTIDATLDRPSGLDAVERFAFDGMARGLQSAVDKVSQGQDPTFECVPVLVHAEGTSASAFPEAARKAVEQCGREIPLTWASLQLDEAEQAGGLTQAIGECAFAKVSLDNVAKRFTDPRLDALRTRSAEVCQA